MADTTTITSKGQVTIPAGVRKRAGLNPGDRVRFVIDDDNGVVLFRVQGSVRGLKRILPKPKQSLSVGEMAAAVREAAAERQGRR